MNRPLTNKITTLHKQPTSLHALHAAAMDKIFHKNGVPHLCTPNSSPLKSQKLPVHAMHSQAEKLRESITLSILNANGAPRLDTNNSFSLPKVQDQPAHEMLDQAAKLNTSAANSIPNDHDLLHMSKPNSFSPSGVLNPPEQEKLPEAAELCASMKESISNDDDVPQVGIPKPSAPPESQMQLACTTIDQSPTLRASTIKDMSNENDEAHSGTPNALLPFQLQNQSARETLSLVAFDDIFNEYGFVPDYLSSLSGVPKTPTIVALFKAAIPHASALGTTSNEDRVPHTSRPALEFPLAFAELLAPMTLPQAVKVFSDKFYTNLDLIFNKYGVLRLGAPSLVPSSGDQEPSDDVTFDQAVDIIDAMVRTVEIIEVLVDEWVKPHNDTSSPTSRNAVTNHWRLRVRLMRFRQIVLRDLRKRLIRQAPANIVETIDGVFSRSHAARQKMEAKIDEMRRNHAARQIDTDKAVDSPQPGSSTSEKLGKSTVTRHGDQDQVPSPNSSPENPVEQAPRSWKKPGPRRGSAADAILKHYFVSDSKDGDCWTPDYTKTKAPIKLSGTDSLDGLYTIDDVHQAAQRIVGLHVCDAGIPSNWAIILGWDRLAVWLRASEITASLSPDIMSEKILEMAQRFGKAMSGESDEHIVHKADTWTENAPEGVTDHMQDVYLVRCKNIGGGWDPRAVFELKIRLGPSEDLLKASMKFRGVERTMMLARKEKTLEDYLNELSKDKNEGEGDDGGKESEILSEGDAFIPVEKSILGGPEPVSVEDGSEVMDLCYCVLGENSEVFKGNIRWTDQNFKSFKGEGVLPLMSNHVEMEGFECCGPASSKTC